MSPLRGAILLGLLALLSSAARGQAGLPEDSRFYPARYYPGVADSLLAETLILGQGESSGDLLLPLDSKGGRIEGQVLGEADPAVLPLGGVLVEAMAGELRALARTLPDGRFSLTGVPPGDVLVRYSTDDRLTHEVRHLALYHPGVPDRSAAARVAVAEGQTVVLDPVVLPPGAVLEGSLRAGDTGSPLAGIEVVIASLAPGAEPRIVRTSPEGRFLLGGLPAGEYTLFARMLGTPYISEFYGGARSASEATVVAIAAGEERNDLVIRPDPGGSIWGEIRHEDSTGLIGIEVQAINASTGELYTALTYGFGQYQIAGVPSGPYRVYVPVLDRYYPDARNESEARIVTVTEPRDVFHIDLKGSPGLGCVDAPGPRGAITGIVRADFSDVTHAVVRGFSATDTFEVEMVSPGLYVLPCLPRGLYKVAFLADGPLAAQYHPKTERFSEAVAVSVQDDTVRTIDFAPIAAVAIEGRVVDRVSGLPLAGVEVRALERQTRIVAQARTDAEGRFLLNRQKVPSPSGMPAGLPPGQWRVLAESTLIPDPVFTPILQPSLTAAPEEGGRIRLEWRLASGPRWRYWVRRMIPEDAGNGSPPEVPPEDAGEIVAEGAAGPQSPDIPFVSFDSPPGSGPYRYALTAWLLSGSSGEGDLGHAVFTAWSDPVRPGDGGPVDPGSAEHPGRAVLQVLPSPWNGRGNVRFRLPQGLQAGGRVCIFSAGGNEVAALEWSSGASELAWDGAKSSPLPTGLYLCRYEGKGGRTARGVLLLIR